MLSKEHYLLMSSHRIFGKVSHIYCRRRRHVRYSKGNRAIKKKRERERWLNVAKKARIK